jgi:hypothetical protein
MNRSKAFCLLVVAGLVLALGLQAAVAPSAADDPSPNFGVQLTQNQVSMWGWPLGHPVTISIDDPSNGPGTDYMTTVEPAPCEWNEETCFWKMLGDEFRVRAGHIVTLTNDSITQVLTVSAVQVTDIDLDADTVSGTAEPGASLHIRTQSNIVRHIAADEAGNWAADFSVPGDREDEQLTLDLIPWHEGTATVSGGYGSTSVTWPVELGIEVGGQIEAHNWYYGDEVTLTIDDPDTPAEPDYTDLGFPEVGPWEYTGLNFDIGGAFRTQPGHIVNLEQNGRSKACVVSPIAITGIDQVTDEVTGVSDPYAHVLASIPLGGGDELARYRYVQADADGSWQVDFSQPGTHIIRHPNEIEVVDIEPGMRAGAAEGTGAACFTEAWRWLAFSATIDIKPGSYPNSINLNSKGVVPVAVLTTNGFGANTVDPVTVVFAGAYPLRWATEDVDYDGDLDLIFHFATQELDLNDESSDATLTGQTFGGMPIEGTDTVNVAP